MTHECSEAFMFHPMLQIGGNMYLDYGKILQNFSLNHWQFVFFVFYGRTWHPSLTKNPHGKYSLQMSISLCCKPSPSPCGVPKPGFNILFSHQIE